QGRAFLDLAGDQSGFRQFAEPGGEHRVADPLDGPSELAEARRPTAKRAKDDSAPASAQQVESTHERRVAPRARFSIQPWFRRLRHWNKTSTPEVTRILGV